MLTKKDLDEYTGAIPKGEGFDEGGELKAEPTSGYFVSMYNMFTERARTCDGGMAPYYKGKADAFATVLSTFYPDIYDSLLE